MSHPGDSPRVRFATAQSVARCDGSPVHLPAGRFGQLGGRFRDGSHAHCEPVEDCLGAAARLHEPGIRIGFCLASF